MDERTCKSPRARSSFVLAIARLRSAYRQNVSGESKGFIRWLVRPGWRWRPKPPVGDDPILWREMNTSRASLLGKVTGAVILLGIFGVLAYVTLFFAAPAVIEVWGHGYGAGITTAEPPDWNIMVRFFLSDYGANAPMDVGRDRFQYLPPLCHNTAHLHGDAHRCRNGIRIDHERANRETWDSLIATPLAPRDILRSKMLASVWRMRATLVTLLALWTLGLCAGAIHPIGFFTATVVTAAWTWLFLVFGLHVPLAAKDAGASTGRTMGIMLLTTGSLVLPFMVPGRWNTVCLARALPLSLSGCRWYRTATSGPPAGMPFIRRCNGFT